MVDIKQPEQEPEKVIESAPIEAEAFAESVAEVTEAPKEVQPAENIDALRQELEKTDLDDSLKLQAQSDADSTALLDEEKKIEKLLELASSKGAVYAVAVAKKMDDPYVLDKLHDLLIEEGLSKDFKP